MWAREGPGRYASIRAVAWVVWADTVGLVAVKVPLVSSVAMRIPAPGKWTMPARDSARSWRRRKPGGPEARKLKKPCHQPSRSSATERAVSRPEATRRGSWP